ncbi:MAG: hypothetical protein L6R41_006378, partial [Letrouitia leprolyta]
MSTNSQTQLLSLINWKFEATSLRTKDFCNKDTLLKDLARLSAAKEVLLQKCTGAEQRDRATGEKLRALQCERANYLGL